MADLEAIILYRPSGFEAEGEFRLARTTAAGAVRAVALAAVEQARAAAALYHGLDAGLERATAAEADRLESVLSQMVPGYEPGGEPARPRLVPPPTEAKP
jgi:hypothetical protein